MPKTYFYDYRLDDDSDGEFSFGEPFPPIQHGEFTTDENLSRSQAYDRIAQNIQEVAEDEELTYLNITSVTR